MATKAKVAKSKLKAAEIAALYAQLAAERPDPRTELDYTDPYTLVVAVALSAQATDVGVNKATKRLFAVADTPEKMVALGEEGVANYIKTIFPFLKEQYEPIVSEIGVDIMEIDEDVPLQDYGIFVKVNSDDIMNNRQRFESIVTTAVQSSNVTLAEAMVLLYNHDTKEAVKKFLALQDRKASQAEQSQEQQMMMQQQMAQQQIIGDTEKQIQVDRARSENKGQLQMLREELKNRTMEQQTQLDMLKKEQEQNFNLIIEALKEQKTQ